MKVYRVCDGQVICYQGTDELAATICRGQIYMNGGYPYMEIRAVVDVPWDGSNFGQMKYLLSY